VVVKLIRRGLGGLIFVGQTNLSQSAVFALRGEIRPPWVSPPGPFCAASTIRLSPVFYGYHKEDAGFYKRLTIVLLRTALVGPGQRGTHLFCHQ
jgi:hypothetical protein